MLHHVNTRIANHHRLDFSGGGLVSLQSGKTPGRLDHFRPGAANFDAVSMKAAANEVFPGKVQGAASHHFSVVGPAGIRVRISAPEWGA